MKQFTWFATIIIIGSLSTFALAGNPLVDLQFPSSPNPVGSGSNALGMGGAFIGIADDATAPSWNPAGLLELEKPEFSFVLSHINRREKNHWANHPESNSKDCIHDKNFNYLSFVYPLPKSISESDIVVALSYQHLYDFNRTWHFVYNHPDPIYTDPVTYQFDQDGSIYALGMAIAYYAKPHLSIGMTLNYWGDFINENKWEKQYHQISRIKIPPLPIGIPRYIVMNKSEEFLFRGWNANFGFQYKLISNQKKYHFRIAGVLKTGFKADIDHMITFETRQTFPEGGGTDTYHVQTYTYQETMHMPVSYGLGFVYCYDFANNNRLNLATDIYRTNWNHFEIEDSAGLRKSPVNGQPSSISHIQATTLVRLGAEYIIRDYKMNDHLFTFSLRSGLFYDPAPADNSPDDYYGISCGLGIAYQSIVFDIAYQYRFGNDVGSSMLPEVDYSQDVKEHTVYTSMVLYF